MENQIIQFCRIRNFRDTNPAATSATWGEFVESCHRPVVRGVLPLDRYLAADKATRDLQKDGPAIIAGHYRTTGTRKQDDLESLAMVTLDFDTSPYTFDEICEKLKCFESVVFTSYSHSEEVPKYRVYLPLLYPVTGQIKPVLGRIISYFDENVGYLDPACLKPGQLFYSPAHPPGAAHLYQCRHISGYVLDPADFPKIEAQAAQRVAAPTPTAGSTGEKPGAWFERTVTWDEVLTWAGWTHFLGRHYTRPGKSGGVSGSVLNHGFYVHSSSEEVRPLMTGRTHTKFAIFAAVEHGGDYSAAARALRRLALHPEPPQEALQRYFGE